MSITEFSTGFSYELRRITSYRRGPTALLTDWKVMATDSNPQSFPERRKHDGYPATPGFPNNIPGVAASTHTGKLPTAANCTSIKCGGCNNIIPIEKGILMFWPLECTVCHRVYAGQHYASLPEPSAEQVVQGIGQLEAYVNTRK
jgi:hypothetical protein